MGVYAMTTQYSAFASAVRLATRWASNHMLLPYFSEEIIELIMMYVFSSATLDEVPGSVSLALLRFFQVLCSFDWDNCPMVIGSEGDHFDRIVMGAFKSAKRAGKAPLMWIATRFNKSSSPMTLDAPDKTTLHRAKLLAAHSESLFMDLAKDSVTKRNKWEIIFTSNLHAFDLVIKVKTLFSNYQPELVPGRPDLHSITDSNPLKYYLELLKERFNKYCSFHYNTFKPDIIGVVIVEPEAKAQIKLLTKKLEEAGTGLLEEVVPPYTISIQEKPRRASKPLGTLQDLIDQIKKRVVVEEKGGPKKKKKRA
eukprot:NODE_2053_length_998_cov_82.742887_g1675_i0.p1 GENE.NODE_2053_length_998_cov_82.742887_g1675_i0~~NODE_2053_length_998_cov_82.742887_g1675_i0.p1  ORF type:complete len:317 (+),score=67.23 NODE_2053_length_998_cov_82.742887_g1675_i0:22-951(+)